MLKSGTFLDKRGNNHTIFILEETGFYRIDICESDARFQVEPHKVQFSLYRKRKSFQYGDSELFKEYEDLQNKLRSSKLPDTVESKWEGGSYFLTQKFGEFEDFFYAVIQRNGTLESEYYKDGDSSLATTIIFKDFDVTEPINKNQYYSIELEESSGDNSSSPYIPLSILKTRYDLSWEKDVDYVVVTDIVEARAYLKIYKSFDDLDKGVDTETDGLDFNLYSDRQLVGVILSHTDGVSRYFPFRHTEFDNLPLDFLEEIVDSINNGVGESNAHNKKFEWKVFFKYGYRIKIKGDSFIASFLANPILVKGAHALKNLAYQIIKKKFLELSDIFLDMKNMNFGKLDKETTRIYACPDGDNVRYIKRHYMDKLSNKEKHLYDIECELAELKGEQEYWGVRIDSDKFSKGKSLNESSLELIKSLIHNLTSSDMMISSPDEVKTLLYDKMKCPIFVRTKTNRPSTSSSALEKLATVKRDEPLNIVTKNIVDDENHLLVKAKDLNELKYPITVLLLKYRELLKLQTSYYNKIQRSAEAQVIEDRNCVRLFFWINQNGTTSGRQSSTLHTLPSEIKADILPDSEDHIMVTSDYAQVELRINFSMAKQMNLVEMCKDPENDMHRAIGSGVTGKEIWDISAKERNEDKARNFGVVYLISGNGLAVQQHGAAPSKEQKAKCDKSIADFYHAYKNVKKFTQDNKDYVIKYKKIKTKFGRTRYFPELGNPELPNDKKQKLIRQANNLPVQGTAADIMKMAEVSINRWIHEKGWDKLVDTPQGKYQLVRLMLSIHDEVILSKHKSVPIEEVFDMLKQCMEIEIEGFAPLFSSPCVVSNWSEGKGGAYEVGVSLRNKLVADYKRTGVSVVKEDAKKELYDIICKDRRESVIDYMEKLILEFGDNIEELHLKVRHNLYTHELIALYGQTKDDIKRDGYKEHREAIKYSTGRYLEWRKDNSIILDEKKEDRQDEFESKNYFEEITGVSDTISYIDAEGEVHFNSENEENEEDDFNGGFRFEDEEDFIEKITDGKKIFVWELFNNFTVDCGHLTKQECNEVLKILHETSDSKAFSEITILWGGKLINTKMKADTIKEREINEYLELIYNKRCLGKEPS